MWTAGSGACSPAVLLVAAPDTCFHRLLTSCQQAHVNCWLKHMLTGSCCLTPCFHRLLTTCRLASAGSSSAAAGPASSQLLSELMPAAAAAAATADKQLLVQLLQGVVGALCEEDSLQAGQVLQVLQQLPLPAARHHMALLAAAYRDGEAAMTAKNTVFLHEDLAPT